MTVHALRFDRDSSPGETDDPARLHLVLADFGRRRLAPALPAPGWRNEIMAETGLRLIEGAFVERERTAVQPLLAGLPTEPAALRHWYLQRSLALLLLHRPAEARMALSALAAIGPIPPAIAPR